MHPWQYDINMLVIHCGHAKEDRTIVQHTRANITMGSHVLYKCYSNLFKVAVARKSILAPIFLKSASRFQYSNLIGCIHAIGMRIMMSL